MNKLFYNSVLSVALAVSCAAQAKSPEPKAVAPKKATAAPNTALQKQAARKEFVLNVVKSAVALPQPDPQDRLRVLSSATSVVSPLDNKMARQFTAEGARLEAELIAGGGKPAVSIFSSGAVDCAVAGQFVD